jgi:hypothetical protein
VPGDEKVIFPTPFIEKNNDFMLFSRGSVVPRASRGWWRRKKFDLRRFFRTSTQLRYAFAPEKSPGLAGRNFCLAIHSVIASASKGLAGRLFRLATIVFIWAGVGFARLLSMTAAPSSM